MKSYNAKIKQKNNNEWNIIYPYTKAKNVSLSNGINLEEVNTSINREIVGINSTKASKEELNNTKEELNENITSINREIVGIKNTKANKEDLENANTNISYVENSLNNFIEYKNLFETEFIGGYVDENGNQQIFENEKYVYAMTKDFISIHNSKEIQIEFILDSNVKMDIHITCIHLYDKNKNYIGNISDKKIKSDNNHKIYTMLIDKENVEYIIPIFKCTNSDSTEYEYFQSSFVNYLNSMNFLLMMPLIKKEKIDNIEKIEYDIYNANNKIEKLIDMTKTKNIFGTMFEQGSIRTLNGLIYQDYNNLNKYVRTKDMIKIESNNNLVIQFIKENNDTFPFSKIDIFGYDKDKKYIGTIDKSTDTENNIMVLQILAENVKNIEYLRILFTVKDDFINTSQVDFANSINFQIEYGLDATDYIPYKLYIKKEKTEGLIELEEKVNELFTSVSNGKNLLETAITDKGGVVSKNSDVATFNELKNGIGNIKTGINIFSQIDKPTSNNGIWIKNNKMYENIDFFDSSEDTTFENEKMTDLSFYFYTTNRTLTIKKEIYILTKYTDSNDNIKSLIYKYNTENNVYEVVSSISDSTSCYFYESYAISVGNYIYLFNLKSIQNPSDCSSYKYNIETNTYTGINNSISISNGSFAIAINNNEIYIFSGTKIYLYNISTNSYETLENCPYDCRYGAGILINNDIYIFGGVSNYAAYKYDIINKQFTKLKDIPSRFSRNNIIKIDNYIYLFGCSSDYKELDGELNAYEENKKSYRYDINSDTYERISDVPYDILAKRVELVGNDIYMLGSNTTTNKRYNIKLTKKELKPNSILFMNTQIIPRYNVKLYNNIDYEKMNNFSFYKIITTNENAEIETVEKYIYNDSKWIKI